MQFTYDPRYNIAYIKFREKTEKEVQSLKISDEVIVDISSDGEIYGIELLNANEQLKTNSGLIFKFNNEATGESSELKLAS